MYQDPDCDEDVVETGAVYVYRFVGTMWTLLGGSPIYSDYRECGACVPNEWFGFHVSISSDGNTLAISNGPEFSDFYVRVLEFEAGNWNVKGAGSIPLGDPDFNTGVGNCEGMFSCT